MNDVQGFSYRWTRVASITQQWSQNKGPTVEALELWRDKGGFGAYETMRCTTCYFVMKGRFFPYPLTPKRPMFIQKHPKLAPK
jgi:hypothetical protein